ncbi:hypothetical protein V8F20_010370 [Naviculisporaceae sp. PSN 640]
MNAFTTCCSISHIPHSPGEPFTSNTIIISTNRIQALALPKSPKSFTMNSNVGNPQVYEAGDQRTKKASELGSDQERFHEGKPNSHNLTDSKDQRSIANRLAAAEKESSSSSSDSKETELHKKDPTLPAKMHGNEPSRGAKIDAELQAEDEAMLSKKK